MTRVDQPPASCAGPDLLEALSTDLDAGFAQLVERYQDLVFSVALRHTAQRGDAEDLASETFLRAYRALCDYDPDRIRGLSPRPWLVTIVLNEARNRHRAASRRPRLSDAAVPDVPAAGRAVEDHAEAAETRRDLARHLEALPTVQREAVVLRHVVDLPVAEIAAVLGCGENTARSHVARGLARLRTSLATEEDS